MISRLDFFKKFAKGAAGATALAVMPWKLAEAKAVGYKGLTKTATVNNIMLKYYDRKILESLSATEFFSRGLITDCRAVHPSDLKEARDE